MDTTKVITQLRNYCPALSTVGGAADFEQGVETTTIGQMPYAFVIPLADDAEPNDLQNGLRQYVTERVAVVVMFDNGNDRRGQGASEKTEQMKYALFRALLNWRVDPERAQQGLEYAGSHFVAMDRGRLFWEFDFDLEVTIIDEDGWQQPSVDLDEIDVHVRPGSPATPTPQPQEPVTVNVDLLPSE